MKKNLFSCPEKFLLITWPLSPGQRTCWWSSCCVIYVNKVGQLPGTPSSSPSLLVSLATKTKKKFLKTVFMSRKISLMDHLAFVTSWVNQPLGRVPKSIRCASNVMRSWLHWVKVVPWWDPLNGFWVALSTIKSQTNTLTGKQQREGGGGGGQETKQAFLSW